MARRSALVTGASRGIGFAIAERLATEGFDLTVTARHPEPLGEAAERLRVAGGGRVVTVVGDMSVREDLGQIVDQHDAAFGETSALVLNAGVGSAGSLADYEMRRFDKTMEVNLRAPVAMIQLALPSLRRAAKNDPVRGARIVVLSSITGVYAEAKLAAYGATKAALSSLVETFNAEEDSGVSATAIAPGYVRTDMAAWAEQHVDVDSMIPVSDIAGIAAMLVQLSSRSMISKVVVARTGSTGYEA